MPPPRRAHDLAPDVFLFHMVGFSRGAERLDFVPSSATNAELQLAAITMTLVLAAAIGLGALAAFNVGGPFDRIATFFARIGASAPDFWIAIVAIVAIVVFAVGPGWLPTSGTGTPWYWICRWRGCSSGPSGCSCRKIAMIFQDPLSHLNPVYRVGWQIAETMVIHGTPRAAARAETIALLSKVGIPDPVASARKYPHQFSGGQRQRIAIAIALALEPRVIVCDEAVAALDVPAPAQGIDLLGGRKDAFGLSYIFIAHDLPVVHDFADRVIVMPGGEIVEQGPVCQIFDAPRETDTRNLLAASLDPVPAVQARRRAERLSRQTPIREML